MDDDGNVIGLPKARKLLEDIPNKVVQQLGIVVDVNFVDENCLQYLEIDTLPHSHPVNYKGHYYYRTGSTMQELKGEKLAQFLLKKQGKHWDDFTLPQISISDLSNEAIERFKKHAAKSNRVDEEVLNDTTDALLENLKLFDLETGELKRAAAMLFYPDPERFATNAYIKIGFFNGDDDDLLFQDDIHGPLMLQIEKALDLIKTKYLTYIISYNQDISREETPQFPVAAIRESLMNAVAHKNYAVASPIQISIYRDRIVFWNPGHLPESWPMERLWEKHPSIPFNPSIANTMFRCGDIENWGRGYKRILKAVKEQKLLPPKLESVSGLMVTYYTDPTTQLNAEKLSEREIAVIDFTAKNGRITNSDVQKLLDVSKSTATRILLGLVDSWLTKEAGGSRGQGVAYILKDFTILIGS